MASALTKIRNGYARGELERAKKADGFQISLEHQGAAGVTLWARSSDSSIDSVDDSGVLNEFESRLFRIPRQSGFTGAISENDEITISTSGLDISSNVYLVRSWNVEDHGAVYSVECVLKTTRRSAP